MKLLLDENLPRSLVRTLSNRFPGTTHVSSLDLLSASDSAIWELATAGGYTIVTKDRDFADRAVVAGQPPKVVWLLVGNCTVDDLHSLVNESQHVLADFLNSEYALLVLPSGLRAG